jgi:hypothetical protein
MTLPPTDNWFVPGVPAEPVLACYGRAAGNEIRSGKFGSPESSAALVANTFGFFLERPWDLPPLPCGEVRSWSARSVDLEVPLAFPWRGGRRPWIDVLIETASEVIGIESKRYEPYRAAKAPQLSNTYWRQVWGERMAGYESIRDQLKEVRSDSPPVYRHLDGGQLVKHALGLRTSVHRDAKLRGKRPVLCYVYAEPLKWSKGHPLDARSFENHRREIASFAAAVAGNEVEFCACSYAEVLSVWSTDTRGDIRAHALNISGRFMP